MGEKSNFTGNATWLRKCWLKILRKNLPSLLYIEKYSTSLLHSNITVKKKSRHFPNVYRDTPLKKMGSGPETVATLGHSLSVSPTEVYFVLPVPAEPSETRRHWEKMPVSHTRPCKRGPGYPNAWLECQLCGFPMSDKGRLFDCAFPY